MSIRLIEIAMGERSDGKVIWRDGVPIGATRGCTTRDVTIRLEVEDSADLARIHDAIASLREPDRKADDDAYAQAWRAVSAVVPVERSLAAAERE